MKNYILALAGVGLFSFVLVDQAEAVTRTQKTFGNWRVDCSDQSGANRCSLRYALLNSKTKRVAFSWTIIPKSKPEGPSKAIIRTPMGVALVDGVSIVFPAQKPIQLSYLTCLQRAGCIAEFDYADAWNKSLEAYPTMTISYNRLKGAPIKHEVSLKNFSEAYKYYQTQNKSK